MKKLQQLFVFILICFLSVTQGYTQCLPDTTTDVTPGIYPDSLPEGTIGAMYDQTVTIVMPRDTVTNILGPTLTIDFCGLVVDSIPNLPAGMSYECSAPNCEFTVNHDSGFVNRFCVKITGSPTETVIPDDSLVVYAHATIGDYDMANDTCNILVVPDSITAIVYKIQWVINDSSATAIEDFAEETLGLSLYPNPSGGNSQLSFELPEAAFTDIQLLDLHGRNVEQVAQQYLTPGKHEFSVGEKSLPQGVYLVQLRLNQGAQVITKKLIIQ